MNDRGFRSWRVLVILAGMLAGPAVVSVAREAAPEASLYQKRPTWSATLQATRSAFLAAHLSEADRAAVAVTLWADVDADFPVACDWVLQDDAQAFPKWFTSNQDTELEHRLLSLVLRDLDDQADPLRRELRELTQAAAGPDDARWLDLYVSACEQRRALRLKVVQEKSPRFVFTRHPTVRPSFYAYTEGQSDAQNERHFVPGSSLCLWEWDGESGAVRTLLDDPKGAIRDPEVSYDGERVVFAWKKSLDGDDYHLYEIDTGSGAVRRITSGLGFADYEPAWLPNGDLIFSSTRCVQTVDCWWTEVSNLYTCAADGRFLRRLTFDQVHSIHPKVTDDGRVIYSRWDYNDRGQIFPQALFQMNADGTGQTEFYKNNSWFPTTIVHARGIPGTEKVLAVFCGHHTTQAGKLGVLDPAHGREDNTGAQLVAPVRTTPAERIDQYGQHGELFQNPYPLTERDFLVGYAPRGWEQHPQAGFRDGDAHFGIYWMDLDGHRELLMRDPHLPCQQPVPLVARKTPPVRPSSVDYRRDTATYYLQDIYSGLGLAGVPRGAVKSLRVIALAFRPAGVGNNGSGGPGGGALVSTPIAIGNGAWDAKIVLGDARVHPDGSAFFTVPTRTPVYFQAIDENGFAAQTMRSWSTLQPGENASCVGCHEGKHTVPIPARTTISLALKAGPQTLDPFHGPARGFSFAKEVQPILDRHCIVCHDDRGRRLPANRLPNALTLQSDPDWDEAIRSITTIARRPAETSHESTSAVEPIQAFSLLAAENVDPMAKRRWSDAYLNLTLARPDRNDWALGAFHGLVDGRVVNWIGSQSIPTPLPPYAAGSARSGLMVLLGQGHHGVTLDRDEWDKIACWIDLYVPFCGDYEEANAWTKEEKAKYDHFVAKRRQMEESERQNCVEYDAMRRRAGEH